MIWIAIGLATLAAIRGMWSPCGLSMLTSLNPMAERSRGYRFATSAGWYVAGALAGGAALGLGCALGAWGIAAIGWSTSTRTALAAGLALIGFVSDARLFGRSLPDHPRQVNERWLRTYRRWLYASGFGAQIGFGFATYIMTAAVYVVAGLAILTASPLAALLIGLSFGAVRGLSILLAADLSTSDRLLRRAQRLDASAAWSQRTLTLSQALVAVALLASISPIAAGAGALAVALGGLIRLRRRQTSAATTSASTSSTSCGIVAPSAAARSAESRFLDGNSVAPMIAPPANSSEPMVKATT
jgi:hypothetical protein